MITSLVLKRSVLAVSITALAATASVARADSFALSAQVVTSQANVRVWLEGGDVYNDYSDVAIWLRPEHDCYTTLYMVDTDGYMHVLYPSSPYDDTWLYGGRSYCYRGYELGLDRLDGAGIAYVFAVGSPVPFDYSSYGASVFVGGFGFRIYGDPFIASRDFYMTLLPVSCRWDYVGVSYARFYVRHWARYPSYLCHGGPVVHVSWNDGCHQCNAIYTSYRSSCARPWDVIRPAARFKSYEHGDRYSSWSNDGRVRVAGIERAQGSSFKSKATKSVVRSNETKVRSNGAKSAMRSHETKSVVRSNQARGFSAKQMGKPAVRSNETVRAQQGRSLERVSQSKSFKKSEAPRQSFARSAEPRSFSKARASSKSTERAPRVVSTSSARERAAVDRAGVAAMKSHGKGAARVTRSDRGNGKSEVAAKGSRSDAREKGSRKKQAR
ncbi:MAG TPA: hypothetical protein VFU38_06660 [Candidatus Krumholzibacteria bacterium]|nr:hypothetical protein [Candidatus Krumholzibacteria bacterium]